MATQFDCHASLQLREKQLARRASHGERVIESIPSDRQSSRYYEKHKANDVKMEDGSRAGDGEEMTGRRNKLRKRDGSWLGTRASSVSGLVVHVILHKLHPQEGKSILQRVLL
ncbi:hypothetical protein SADUNF_Sadunf03G0076100 [Salix dunnii]|uniref:Uncharacterized protein n=1 Tax=Salix dunnii TaxID=1413687 RepID=A0A835KGP8_9ROSI|nr:hypothetical protein SADUNF_Sadunf03G0076100 [Salix dunnii]